MLHCYFATVWIQNSGGIATTSTLPTLHHWICQGWDCKNVGGILQQEPHCLDEQQRQCYRLKKSSDQKHTFLLQRYCATDQTWTPNLRTKGHPLHRYNATDWKKAQTKNTPPCYSATPLQTRREHIIWELRATRYTATILQTEKKGKSRERWMQTMWWQNGLCSREDGLSFYYECLNVCLNVYLPLKQGVKQFVSWR